MGTFAGTSYVLDNDRPAARRVLGCLSLMLDEFTIGRLLQASVPVGGRCLELGAGNGSVACWLAERVGARGQMIATDLKTQHVRHHPGVTVLRHDAAVEPLPAGPFDVVHARLLLAHLPSRYEVLARMVDVLRPGGLLLVEEFGQAGAGMVLSSPDRSLAEIYSEFQGALAGVYATAGTDAGWAVQVNAAMTEVGLVNVDTVTHARSWTGGTAGCALPLALSMELREQLVAASMVERELDRLGRLLVDPHLVLMGDLLWSHLGRQPRRPTAEAEVGGVGPHRGLW
ncbi:MAG TPA: class I SAM-dependent methyltransferase [Micromonosporaceae bacterium]|nr:class I SAM-dependent methyltransferase [Micromonosporaceae bacterium]